MRTSRHNILELKWVWIELDEGPNYINIKVAWKITIHVSRDIELIQMVRHSERTDSQQPNIHHPVNSALINDSGPARL